MPYVFTDWEHCTDLSGNAQVLDWTESGMIGRPAGIYLEALRQAAYQRNRQYTEINWTMNGDVANSYLFAGYLQPNNTFLDIHSLLKHVDAVAWDTTQGAYVGWLDPRNGESAYDISGEQGSVSPIPAPVQTEAQWKEIAGIDERIPRPLSIRFGLQAKYLLQLQALLKKRTLLQWYNPTPSVSGGMCKQKYLDTTNPATWAEVQSAFDALSWEDVSGLGMIHGWQWGYQLKITKQAFRPKWIMSGDNPACKHVTGYFYIQALGDFYSPDYPLFRESTWEKAANDISITDYHGAWTYEFGAVGSQPPFWVAGPGYVYPKYWGSGVESMLVHCDYSEDFTLGA